MPRLTSHGESCYEKTSSMGPKHAFWGPFVKWWPGTPAAQASQEGTNVGCGACQKKAESAQFRKVEPMNIGQWFSVEKDQPPDFKEHMDTLRELCASVKHATEMSTWPKQAYLAIAAGMPADGVLVSLATSGKSWWGSMKAAMKERFKTVNKDSVTADIEPTELLFLDSAHTAQRTYDELVRHSGKVSKYIVIHTVAKDTFGEIGDDGGPGVMAGVRQWLREGASRDWVVKRFDEHNHGLLVLSHDPADRPKVEHGIRSAWRYVRSKIRHKLNGGNYLPLPMAQERLDICLTCDKRGGAEGNNCKVCGCFLAEIPDHAPLNKGQPGKAFVPTEMCPIGKWMDRPADGVQMTPEEIETMLDTLRTEAESVEGPAKPAVYSISGDLGDVVFSLSVIKKLGGGDVVLYPSSRTMTRMTREHASKIAPLVASQDYITRLSYSETPEGVDLDSWRSHVEFGTDKTHLDAMSEAFLGRLGDHAATWLSVEPKREAPVVFHRTYKSKGTLDWKAALASHPDAVFIGLPEEHEAFQLNVGPIRFVPTDNLLEFAQIIAGADRLICNQSVGLTIAYGLGKPVTCELVPGDINCNWGRPDCVFVGGPRGS